jgi:hypothetical protein
MAIVKKGFCDLTWEQMLRRTSSDNQLLLCERLLLKEEWKASGQEPSLFLEKYFLANQDIFLMMLSADHLDLLFEIWDTRKTLDLEPADRRNLLPLENLGFIYYDHQNKQVVINEEARDNFYFSLKSRSSVRKNRLFQDLELAVKGILYQCGIIEITSLYDMIKGTTGIEYSQFWLYLVCRMEFWSFLGILRNRDNGEIYAISYEVRNRNQVFYDWMNQAPESFKSLEMEDAILLGTMNGIGEWEGTGELLAFCMDSLYEDIVASTVFVKTILVDIQNGAELDKIEKKIQPKIADFTEYEIETVYCYLKKMYLHTPIYGLKGFSRYEREKMDNHFSVINGGKTE